MPMRTYDEDEVVLLETNIDDLSPEVLGYLFDRLFECGALDVYSTAITMKKNRPALKLSVLVPEECLSSVRDTIFKETTTFGLRMVPLRRVKLFQEQMSIETPWGPCKVKVGKAGDAIMTVAAEYDDCASLAQKEGIPLKTVYAEVMKRVNI